MPTFMRFIAFLSVLFLLGCATPVLNTIPQNEKLPVVSDGYRMMGFKESSKLTFILAPTSRVSTYQSLLDDVKSGHALRVVGLAAAQKLRSRVQHGVKVDCGDSEMKLPAGIDKPNWTVYLKLMN